MNEFTLRGCKKMNDSINRSRDRKDAEKAKEDGRLLVEILVELRETNKYLDNIEREFRGGNNE